MDYILKAIKDHPEAFNHQINNDLLDDELLQILYSVKNHGTSIQREALNKTKLYFGWTVLIKLGLRYLAIPMVFNY